MAKNPELVKVEAISAFTVTTPDGQFHGDPDSERNRFLKVPADKVDQLLKSGRIKLREGADLPQLDHDGDGEPGGSVPVEPPSLAGKNRAELEQIATDEGVDLNAITGTGKDGKVLNADVEAAIEANRAAAADAPADEAPTS